MKKVCIVLCIIIIAFILCISQILAATCGDTNSDGSVNIADSLLVAQFSVGGNPANFDQGASDVNGDGTTNIADALLISQYYVGIINQLSCQGSTNPTTGNAQITLNSNSISVNGTGVSASGNKATITSAGIFNVSGSISNGQIIVDTQDEEKVEINLNSVSITCSNSAPINVKNGEVKLTLVGNNSITDGTSYVFDNAADEEPNAAIFSKDDLTINGDGSLTVRANFRDGINCNDDLKISSGTINVTAVDDGIVGNESIEVNGGNITVNSSGDCLKVTEEEDTEKGDAQIDGGTLNLTSTNDDGISAFRKVEVNDGNLTISASSQGLRSDMQVEVNGGKTTVTQCNEGIEAKEVYINGGSFIAYARDDALNATMGQRTEQNDGSIVVITGGTHYLDATSGDGIDSNGTFRMTGGTVGVCGPANQPNVAIDINASIEISGGTLIATSASSFMNNYPTVSSSQYALASALTSGQSANSIVCIRDSSGNDLVRFRAARNFQVVIFASPGLRVGSTYSIIVGGNVSGGTEVNRIITGGTYSGGTTVDTITLGSQPTTTSGNFNSGGFFGF